MIPSSAKRAIIAAGLYRPARWLSRTLSSAQRQVYLDGVAFYRGLLPIGGLCFDVGANIGARSEELIDAGMHVVAFEPNPRILPELRARCGHYGPTLWTLIQAAVGARSAVSTFNVPEAHQQASLIPNWEGQLATATYDVPVVTLDAAVAHYGVPAYCKIDVEGYELEVLNGLSSRIPLLSIELHTHKDKWKPTAACLSRLASFGPAMVNVALAETPSFHFPEWVPLTQFATEFPGNVKGLSSSGFGDLFVKCQP